MKLDKVISNKILTEYSLIQNRATRIYNDEIKKIYRNYPILANIDKDLVKLYIIKAKNKLRNEEKEVDSQIDIAISKRKDFINTHNIKLPSKYCCDICKDTGTTVEGKKCICYNKIFKKVMYENDPYRDLFNKYRFENLDYILYDNSVDEKNNINISNREIVRMIEKSAEILVDAFTNNKEYKYSNYLLMGEVGVGKTYIALSIGNLFLDRSIYVKFISSNELSLKLGSFDEENREFIEFIKEVPVLIIDDLGVEFLGKKYIAELYDLIYSRQINKLPTIFTTNMTIDNLANYYTQRFISKLEVDTRFFMIYGNDLRQSK